MTLEAKRIEQQYYFDPAQATAANSGISGADQAKITSIHFFGIRKCFCIFSFHANLFYLKQIRVERTNILSDQKHFFVFAGNDNFITNNPNPTAWDNLLSDQSGFMINTANDTLNMNLLNVTELLNSYENMLNQTIHAAIDLLMPKGKNATNFPEDYDDYKGDNMINHTWKSVGIKHIDKKIFLKSSSFFLNVRFSAVSTDAI